MTTPKKPGPTAEGFLLPNGWTIRPAGRQVPLTDLPLNILPLADGSWRLNFFLWAVPAILIPAVFLLLSPKQAHRSGKGAAAIGAWWPDWRNPLIWLLGFTFGSNNSPFFTTNAFVSVILFLTFGSAVFFRR